jgi:hypothetical protein
MEMDPFCGYKCHTGASGAELPAAMNMQMAFTPGDGLHTG